MRRQKTLIFYAPRDILILQRQPFGILNKNSRVFRTEQPIKRSWSTDRIGSKHPFIFDGRRRRGISRHAYEKRISFNLFASRLLTFPRRSSSSPGAPFLNKSVAFVEFPESVGVIVAGIRPPTRPFHARNEIAGGF